MLKQNDTILQLQLSACSGDIFSSVEISRSDWMIGLHTPLSNKILLHKMVYGNVDALLTLVERQRKKLAAAGNTTARVIVCYEAGYEGFWLQRRLDALGVRDVIIDPASLLVDRRAKPAKTDRIDARALVRALMAYTRSESQVLSEVRVPTVAQDDD